MSHANLDVVGDGNASIPTGVVTKVYAHSVEYQPDAQIDIENLVGNFLTHKRMISASASAIETASPVYYIMYPKFENELNYSSSKSLLSSVSDYYINIENQLSLLAAPDSDEIVEKGAVESALALVTQLKSHNLAPPALSWHGGDAVVMLWALGDTTYAITVTEGELGYVVRRNRKPIRMADSIKLDTFKLADLR